MHQCLSKKEEAFFSLYFFSIVVGCAFIAMEEGTLRPLRHHRGKRVTGTWHYTFLVGWEEGKRYMKCLLIAFLPLQRLFKATASRLLTNYNK